MKRPTRSITADTIHGLGQEADRSRAPQAPDTLQETWQQPSGFLGWLMAVNHRAIGTRYVVTGLVFFVLAGIAALLMRIQLAAPENTFLNAEAYNQLMTMHGTTMMFVFAVPILQGVGIYFLPLMIGARDMAFPRLNAYGYWCYLFAGTSLWLSLFFGAAPNGGWFNYTPLSTTRYTPDLNIDFWATSISFLEVAALVAATEIIVTTMQLRAPGMSINRIPLTVWATVTTAFTILFAMPPLMTASLMLEMDRKIATNFFNVEAGGSALLWQHLFWFFGHPEVYIILLPALGFVAAIAPTFTRRPLVGYVPLVLSFVAIAFLSFGVWVHHMFATDLAPMSLIFQSMTSFVIAIPSGVQIFALLATFWYGRLWFRVPLYYIFGFIFVFVIGGISGVMIASIAFGWQVHDTYFLVAHFHYVLIGGSIFPLLGAIYYWFPKVTGRLQNERLGRWAFWLFFIGFNVTFFPMHMTGFQGMTRRDYTYLAGIGLEGVNLTSTIGAFLTALGVLLYLWNLIGSARRGAPAPDNPWGAGTLEWATTSPPASYNFRLPALVRDAYPLWHERASGAADQERLANQQDFGLLTTRRETLGTTILDAVPEQRIVLLGPTIVPLFTALATAVMFIGLVFDVIFVAIGFVLFFIMLVIWHKPDPEGWDMTYVRAGMGRENSPALPTNMVATSFGLTTTIWWGIVALIVIEIVMFGALISAYFYLRSGVSEWPIGDIDPPDLLLPTLNSLILWSSVIPHYLAKKAIERGDQRRLCVWLAVAGIMTLVFLTIKVIEYANLDYNWANNAYTSIMWTITGFHIVHTLAVVLKTGVVGYYGWRGYFNAERYEGVVSNALYAYFVAAIWVPLYLTLYLAPRVI